MNQPQPIHAGTEIAEPTLAIPRLRPENFPGFMSAARVDPSLILASRGSASFQHGCGKTHGWAVCGDDDYVEGEVKCNTKHQANIAFRPRTFYALRECADWLDEINWADQVNEDLIQQANTELSLLLESDDGRGQNPSLVSTAQNLTPGSTPGTTGTAVSVMRGFSLLLGAFAAVGGGLGSFHGSSTIVPYGTQLRQLSLDGNIYRGPMRLPYNPGPGFRNSRPVSAGGDVQGSVIEGDGTAWLYGIAGSQAGYRIGQAGTFEMQEHRANTRGALAEHKAIVRFNTCGVFAVLVCTNDVAGVHVGS